MRVRRGGGGIPLGLEGFCLYLWVLGRALLYSINVGMSALAWSLVNGSTAKHLVRTDYGPTFLESKVLCLTAYHLCLLCNC
ncbi:hypothetical protein BO78DRAFT_68927 [Aspergillus sclerotiicarbonarius CBS 121057]|uniref:Uncharacterized protein n=1 Tax=Aspergillus sclerotiicarbonarius (strain CBS 121057 / IBT 28362) TaxID=1448318 RepID=A0A319F7I8_ASPSB|nr:hypothetical protein BO78DRAFT_68927 [Aspergillus sclerotiicarbonarius CBS 121057]